MVETRERGDEQRGTSSSSSGAGIRKKHAIEPPPIQSFSRARSLRIKRGRCVPVSMQGSVDRGSCKEIGKAARAPDEILPAVSRLLLAIGRALVRFLSLRSCSRALLLVLLHQLRARPRFSLTVAQRDRRVVEIDGVHRALVADARARNKRDQRAHSRHGVCHGS